MSGQTDIFREERGVSPCILDGSERAIFIEWNGEKARVFRQNFKNKFREDFFFEVDADRVKLCEDWVVCLFDTETTGLPKSFGAPASDVENWPRIVELAFSVSYFNYKTGLKTREKIFDLIVDPEDFEIPKDASAVHGITQEQAEIEGLPILYCLEKFSESLEKVDFIVAHNIAFDEKVVGAEIIRAGDEAPFFPILPKVCSMRGYQKKFGGKNLSLSALYELFFKEKFEGAHRAEADTFALSKCFEQLLRQNIINPKKEVEDFLKTQKGF